MTQKAFAPIAIILIIAGILIIGGGAWYVKSKIVKQQDFFCPTVVLSYKNPTTGECREFGCGVQPPAGWQRGPKCKYDTNQTANSSTTLTTTWQTYRNDEYRFEFKYPQEGILTKDEIPFLASFLYEWGSDFCSFNIVVDSKNDYSEIIKGNREKNYKETKIIIDKIDGIRFDYNNQTTPSFSPTSEVNIEIFFDKGSNHYRLLGQSYPKRHEVECKDLINQILSTFKFIK